MHIELHASGEDRRVAALAAAAIGLTLAEAAIPLPIPGVKPGLANIVTLVVLYRYGWRTAAWVAGCASSPAPWRWASFSPRLSC